MLKKDKRIKLGKRHYQRLMKQVLTRDDWRCQKCGSLENLQVHHRVRRSQQGDDSLANLITLCAYCHMAEHSELAFEPKAMGFSMKSKKIKAGSVIGQS
jgi:5-methylcytosine-specific restriction endonuclease McrA